MSDTLPRLPAVVAVIRDGMPVTEVAEKFGVHRDTIHGWLARYEAEGLDGRADRSHRPHRSPLQMPAATEARVLDEPVKGHVCSLLVGATGGPVCPS